jgi:hypothetical protein
MTADRGPLTGHPAGEQPLVECGKRSMPPRRSVTHWPTLITPCTTRNCRCSPTHAHCEPESPLWPGWAFATSNHSRLGRLPKRTPSGRTGSANAWWETLARAPCLQWPRSPRSHPREPPLEQFGVQPIGLCPAMFPRNRHTRGMDHVCLYPARLEPARQPKAVAAGFEGQRNPRDCAVGPDGLIPPAM